MVSAIPASSRAVVRDLPNFRDNGRTVDTALLRLVCRLQEKWGRAFVSERSLRAMVYEDVQLMAGVSTIPKALVRLGKQGLVVQVWLIAGQMLPDGSTCTHGARLLWCPQNGRQRATARKHNARQNRRAGERNRHVPAAMAVKLLGELVAGKKLPPPPPDAGEGLRGKVADAQAALAALAAQWERDGKPPD